MATVAKGYDLDYAWRDVGEAYRGAGDYLAAAGAGEPPGTWWGPGAERLGFTRGQVVEREPYNLLFGERKGPDGSKLGRAPANAGKAVEIYKGLVAAEPGADDHRRAELRIEAQRQARQSQPGRGIPEGWRRDQSLLSGETALRPGKSSSQNSVTPRAPGGASPPCRSVSWARSSTRRILPEIVFGRSENSSLRTRL